MECTSRFFSHYSAEDAELKEFPFSSEAALQGYIDENPNILSLRDGDVEIIGLEKNWVRGDGKGRIDVLAAFEDSYGVVELKKELDTRALEQLKSYLSNKEWLKKVELELSEDDTPAEPLKWEGILVGMTIPSNSNLITEVEKYNSDSEIPISVIVIERYRNKEGQIFSRTEVYLSGKEKGKRDYSKYLVNGLETKKSQSLLYMVKSYVKKNPDLTIENLKEKLKEYRGRGLPVLTDYEEAVRKANGVPANSCYIIGDKKAVELPDGKVAVLGFWKTHNLPILKRIAEVLECDFKKA